MFDALKENRASTAAEVRSNFEIGPSFYSTSIRPGIQAAKLARRFGISLPAAAVVAELAGLRGVE